jgi:putative tricarboxylic transport membrane protein
VLTIPQGVLSAIVVMFCLVGAYANRNSMSDVWMIVIFGILGYLFEKFRFPISPMVLGAILGPIGETAFMRSMIASNNDWTVFFKGPISGTLMGASVIALSYPLLREFLAARRRRQAVAQTG